MDQLFSDDFEKGLKHIVSREFYVLETLQLSC
jgi:hypothetical protein